MNEIDIKKFIQSFSVWHCEVPYGGTGGLIPGGSNVTIIMSSFILVETFFVLYLDFFNIFNFF